MVVGAGSAGYMLVREMKNSKHLNRKVPCIIDDDPQKIGTYLQGIPIVGTKEEIPAMAKKYNIEEIIIAIPTLEDESRHELLEICQKTACKIKMLPGIYQMVNQEVDVSMLRDVSIEDLLGREPWIFIWKRSEITSPQSDHRYWRRRFYRKRDMPSGCIA